MTPWVKYRWLAILAMGLFGGFILSGQWPHTPLHGTATDRVDSFAIATGAVDNETEAVYFLDFLTGDLRATVLSQVAGSFSGFFARNVMADLGVDPQKNPKFLMVTGRAGLRRYGGSRMAPSTDMCYVFDVTSGMMAAYAIPWSTSQWRANQINAQELVLVAVTPFRQSAAAIHGGHGNTGTPAGGPRKP